MGSTAEQFAAAGPAPRATRKGPVAACDIYGPGDRDILAVIDARRENGEVWVSIQTVLDGVLGITKSIHNDKFRYHWTTKCAHWDQP